MHSFHFLYSEIRRHLSPHLYLHRALSFWWFDMHSLSVRAENYTACFHNPHLNVAFHEKVGIIALCLCTCVIPESQKTLLEFLWKACKSLLWHGSSSGWSGCNILELAMIAEYSGRQVGTHVLMLFLLLFPKVRGGKWEGGICKICYLNFAGTISIHLTPCWNERDMKLISN